MKHFKVVIFLSFLIFVDWSTQSVLQKLYDNRRIIHAFPESQVEQALIRNVNSHGCKIVHETQLLDYPIEFLCNGKFSSSQLEDFLSHNQVRFETKQFRVESSRDKRSTVSEFEAENDSISFDRYCRYSEIIGYLERLESRPDLTKFLSIDWGKNKLTHESRKMPIVKIGNSPLGNETRAVWIDAGIHAREWIAPATALFVIDNLIKAFKNSDSSREDRSLKPMLQVNWYIVPLLNPDGYEYSHKVDRMWRKNRSPPPPGSRCFGVDLNRNYDVEGFGIGASSSSCSEVYKGQQSNSQPEVQRASEFLLKNQNNIRVSISLHSHGQLILTSWGYKSELPVDNDKLIHFGNVMKDAILKTTGRIYQVGPAGVIFYAAGGASDDFAKASATIPYVATVELPDNQYGFLLPESEIVSVGSEIFEAMKAVANLAATEPLGPDVAHRLEIEKDRTKVGSF